MEKKTSKVLSYKRKVINLETFLTEFLYSPEIFTAGNYMFKVNNRNTRARCEICSKLTRKTPERRRTNTQPFSQTGQFGYMVECSFGVVLVSFLITFKKQLRLKVVNSKTLSERYFTVSKLRLCIWSC